MTKLLLVGLIAFAVPISAWGAPKLLTVVRGTGAGADKAAGFVGYYVREQLAQDKRYNVLTMDAVMGSARSEQAAREFTAADELAEQCQVAYESLDLDLAVQHCEQAIERYRTQIAYLENVEPVAKILMLLGATHILRGEEDTGIARLTQALRISPSIEPDPRIFNPAMRRIFDGVAESMATQTVGSLAISSNPSYAEVFVDGVFRGITPLTLDGVGAGEHWIRIVKEGFHSAGEVQSIIAQRENGYVGTLRSERTAEQYEEWAQEVAQRAQKSPEKMTRELSKLASTAKADYVLVVAVQLDGDRVQLSASQFDMRRKKFLASGNNVLNYSTEGDVYRREVRALLQRSFGEGVVPMSVANAADGPTNAADGSTPPGALDPDVLGQSAGEVGTKFDDGSCEWWAWCQTKNKVALGLGVGGLAMMGAGAGLWYGAKGKNDDFPSAPQTSQQAKDLKSSGQTYALTGDILVFAGGALALGAVAAFFWPFKYGKKVDIDDTAAPSTAEQPTSSVQPVKRNLARRILSDMQWNVGAGRNGAMLMTTWQY